MSNTISRRSFVKGMGAASVLGATALVAGCGGNGGANNANAGEGFKIGGIGPLTGAAAIYGNATNNATKLAVDEINAKGGAVKFQFNGQDDEHDPEKSVNAYNNLKDWGMQILVGCTTTAPSVAVSAETNSDNMFQITPSGSSTDVIGGQPDASGNVTAQRKKNVFQMCFTDPNQGTASAEYIATQKLGTRIAIIYNNSDAYSTGIYKKFVDEAAAKGLTIVSTTTFTDDSANDFSVQLNDAKNNNADLVFLPIYYQPASLILTQANSMGFAPKWFGVDGMDGILTLEGFDTKLAEGVMLLTPFVADAPDEKTQNFVNEYKKRFGDTPNQFAADAYDCVYMLAAALEKAGCTADMSKSDICDKLVSTITSADFTFSGLTGDNMTWSSTGEVSKSPKGMVIQNGTYVSL